MATPYSDIYDIFLSNVSDYSFANLTDAQIDDIISKYLRGSTIRFKHCKNDLTMDDVNQQFTATLTDEEQEILGVLMVIQWIKPKINNTLLLSATMTDRDFQMYSQANQLKAMQGLKKDMEAEAQRLIRDYTYGNTSDLGGLVSGVPKPNDAIASEIPTTSQSTIAN